MKGAQVHSLAVIDDRKQMRTTVQRQVELLAGDRFRVFEHEPLPAPADYPSWVLEEDVAALIIDERLNEQKASSGKHVTYTGHEVVDELRKSHRGLPIFVLTSFPSDEALTARIDTVNVVMDRRTFTSKPSPFVARIVRDAETFSGFRDSSLVELSDLAERIASGTATQRDKRRAKALRLQLNVQLPIAEFQDHSEWLTKAEKQLEKLKKVREAALALKAKDAKR